MFLKVALCKFRILDCMHGSNISTETNFILNDSAVAATKYSRYFFFTFYVVGVMLANNLVVAVVIDYFIDELDSKRSKTDERFEASDIFASRKVGKYVARLKPKYRLTAQSKHDVLEELFSPKEGVQAS